MLALSRKRGEKVLIGNDIEITVVSIDRNKVRIGIVAPRELPIFRSELLESDKKGGPSEKAGI